MKLKLGGLFAKYLVVYIIAVHFTRLIYWAYGQTCHKKIYIYTCRPNTDTSEQSNMSPWWMLREKPRSSTSSNGQRWLRSRMGIIWDNFTMLCVPVRIISNIPTTFVFKNFWGKLSMNDLCFPLLHIALVLVLSRGFKSLRSFSCITVLTHEVCSSAVLCLVQNLVFQAFLVHSVH